MGNVGPLKKGKGTLLEDLEVFLMRSTWTLLTWHEWER